MPPVGTRAGIPPIQQVETLYVNVFLPGGTPPPKGWPVVIFGLGGRDYKDEMPWLYAPAFASYGMATACINVAGEAYGPLSFITGQIERWIHGAVPGGRSRKRPQRRRLHR